MSKIITWECPTCGTAGPIQREHAAFAACLRCHAPRPTLADCRWRRAKLRLAGCANCPGAVKVKVYACKLLGECTLGDVAGVTKCTTACHGYQPRGDDDGLDLSEL